VFSDEDEDGHELEEEEVNQEDTVEEWEERSPPRKRSKTARPSQRNPPREARPRRRDAPQDKSVPCKSAKRHREEAVILSEGKPSRFDTNIGH